MSRYKVGQHVFIYNKSIDMVEEAIIGSVVNTPDDVKIHIRGYDENIKAIKVYESREEAEFVVKKEKKGLKEKYEKEIVDTQSLVNFMINKLNTLDSIAKEVAIKKAIEFGFKMK